MTDPVHVLIRLKDQETYFAGKPYPHYEIGWKHGDQFTLWNGYKKTEEDVEEWEEI